jgi:hypothetical protein
MRVETALRRGPRRLRKLEPELLVGDVSGRRGADDRPAMSRRQ